MHTVVKPTPPGAPNEARFHVRYVTAVAAACGGPIVPEHSEECLRHLAQPAVADAYEKISAVPDGTLTHYHQAPTCVNNSEANDRRNAPAPP